MKTRLLAALVALTVPMAAFAADDEHPYKNAKVGDFVTYKMTMNAAGMDMKGTVTSTVVAKTDKEVTVEASGNMAGRDIPKSKQKIDLTKPFDPTKGIAGGGGAGAKVEKVKDGKEKVTVGEKSYEATWTTYKITAQAKQQTVEAQAKVWMAKDVPGGMVKMETTSKVGPIEMKMTMELEKSGNNKDK